MSHKTTDRVMAILAVTAVVVYLAGVYGMWRLFTALMSPPLDNPVVQNVLLGIASLCASAVACYALGGLIIFALNVWGWCVDPANKLKVQGP
jgi:hypothetical protein